MQKILRKNKSYSKLMLTEGATTTVDEDMNYEMKLPDWADENKIKRAWQSINNVHKMHVVLNKRATKAGIGIISQKDMAITQFLFMGFSLWKPEMFGIVGSEEQFEAFNHFWRLIGHLLGIEDRFNVCGDTVEETQSRLQSMAEDMLLPAWKDQFPGCASYSEIAFDGLWTFDPSMHYDSMIFMIKRAFKVPGCQYFDPSDEIATNETKKIFDDLSLYTKFRIFVDVLMFEYLSHIFVFRWIFNVIRLFIVAQEIYPILAIVRFGRKYAFVEVLKEKKLYAKNQ